MSCTEMPFSEFGHSARGTAAAGGGSAFRSGNAAVSDSSAPGFCPHRISGESPQGAYPERTCPCPRRVAGRSKEQAQPARLVFIDEWDVWVTRKPVKNLHLRVKPDGSLAVSAPLRLSDARIEEFVRSKRDWIAKTKEKLETSPSALADGASTDEVAAWKAVVQAFVPPLVEKWEPLLGVKAGKLAYRNMTSRWGSCQPSTGRICINVRLALYPPECLEYVVVHELCHLIERGHGPRFYALLDAHLPQWREARDKLRY